MVLISRTGLQESEKRSIKRCQISSDGFLGNDSGLANMMPPIAVPATLAPRPFAGLPNPFSRTGGACSILCNHPAPASAVRGLLQAAKGEESGSGIDGQNGEEDDEEEAVVPEELFRRYTETDSRPLTPALSSASDTQVANRSEPADSLFYVSSPPSISATTVSTRRRYGPGSLSRRSQTPDPPHRPQPPQRHRTMLVLDLRRSRSQDGGFWMQQSKGGQSPSPASSESPKHVPNQAKAQISAQGNKRSQQQVAARAHKQIEQEATPKAASNVPTVAGKKKVAPKRVEKKGKSVAEEDSEGAVGGQGGQVGTKVMPPTPREEDMEERPSPPLERKGARKRPHKKKKKGIGCGGLEAGAMASGRGETPEKEFRGMPEPRETQISTMAGGGDTTSSLGLRGPSRATPDDALFAYDARDGKHSTLPHTRPSTSQTRASPAVPYTLETLMGCNEVNEWDDENSFLDPLVLRHLERELDREAVECEFHPLRRRALGEALKSKWLKLHHHSRKKEKLVSMGNVHQYYGLDTHSWCQEPTNLWLTLPRTFSRQSARFELPLDSRKFRTMTPLKYLQEHVVISSGRCLLYNRVFNRHRNKDKQDEEPDEDDICYPEERIMSIDRLVGALSEVMGKDLTTSQAEYFLRLCETEKKDSGSMTCHTITVTPPEEKYLNFRTFSGIAALCERLIGGGAILFKKSDEESTDNPVGLLPPRSVDPPNEVEIVDFEPLPNHLRAIPEVNRQLSEILMLIKEL